MKGLLKRVLAVALSGLMAMTPVSVSAISEEDLYFYGQNNIVMFDLWGCSSIMTGSYDGTASAGLSALQSAFVDQYHAIAENLSVEFGIPWETVMAQGILESASGTSFFARDRNNFFGIGAFDSNPNNAFSYATPEEGWRGYYEDIKKTATYRNHGVFEGEAITNPYVYAQRIKDAGYATDPNYVAKLTKLIVAVENRANERGWMLSAALAQRYPEMIANANANAAGSNTSAVSFVVSASCVFNGNGNINETAISLSWPDRTHAPTDPKPEYQQALRASNGVATRGEGDVCSIGGYSCDAFLATVMRTSGVDPDFPCCGAALQLNYLVNSPLYEEIPNLGNTSNLQPGDIRASGSHVEIVVRMDDGTYKIASASHCDRTADHAADYYAGLNFRVFRRVGASNV